MADWVTISALTTAGGTLVLAAATFSSVRSANRAARVAERSLLAGLRPLLATSRLEDPVQKITWVDGHWSHVGGSDASLEVTEDVLYLAMPVRNAGAGFAVLHGWVMSPTLVRGDQGHAGPEEFRPQSRDLYIAPNDLGFWQGAIRDPADPQFAPLAATIEAREPFSIDLLYGDHEGGQRTITRFSLFPRERGDGWLCSVGRHWNLDRSDPR